MSVLPGARMFAIQGAMARVLTLPTYGLDLFLRIKGASLHGAVTHQSLWAEMNHSE